MKKLVILAALMAMSVSSWAAVATVALNNFDADKPIYALTAGTPAPVNADYFVQLLGGPTGGPLGPVVPTSGGTGIIGITDFAGYFEGGIGIVPGATAGGQSDFELRAWKGAGGYDNALEKGSLTWSQGTGSWDNTAQPPPPPSGLALAIPGNVLTQNIVPEPSTIALGLLGAAALLIRRRK